MYSGVADGTTDVDAYMRNRCIKCGTFMRSYIKQSDCCDND